MGESKCAALSLPKWERLRIPQPPHIGCNYTLISWALELSPEELELGEGLPHIANKLQAAHSAYPLGPQVLQLETEAFHHQLCLLFHGTGCVLSAQHVL